MEEQVVLAKTSFLTMKRLFVGKSMKIHKLEKDNEKLRQAFQKTIANHHARSKIGQDSIENVEPASSPSSQEVPQRCSRETVGQGNSAPSIQNQIAVSYKRTQCSYLTSAPPLVSSEYPAANSACARVPNSSSNTPPFNELCNSQVSQQLPRSQVRQPNPEVLGYPAFSEMRNTPPPPYQNFPNFHSSSASVSFLPNQTLSYQSSVPVNSHRSLVPVNSHQSLMPVNSHQSSMTVNNHQSSMTVNGHQSSVPLNSHQSSVPVNSHQSSVPVNGHHSSVPVNSHQSPVPMSSHQSSVPVNGHQSSVPVNGHQSSAPVNGYQSSVPVNGHQSSVPVNSHQSPVPVNSHQSSVPVNSHQSSVPGNSHQSPVLVNSQQSSVPVNSQQSSVPLNSHQSSVPVNGHQSSVHVNSHQLSVPVNSHQSSVPVNSHQSLVPVNSHQSLIPVNSHQSTVPVNSHQSLLPVNSHQYQSSVPVNSHRSSVPVNQTQAYSQVQHQTSYAQLSLHHQPQPCFPVPNQSHFRNLHHSQPQNCPQATLQGRSGAVHHYPQMYSQALQNMSSNTSSYHQHQAVTQPQHQTYPASQFPYPGIQNASPNQVQQHHPPNHAIPRQRLHVRRDLHSHPSFTNSTSQNQSSFGRVPGVLQGTVTSHGCQLSGEENDRPLWQTASREVSSPNESLLPENNNFSNVLSHDKSDEEDSCSIIYDSGIVATNKSHDQSPFARLQNSSNTYPVTGSGNSCQTDNHGQATITSEPFTCPGPSIVNTKTESLPSVITPPLTPPTPNSSRPVQLKSSAHCNVTFIHDPNLSPVQNLFTPQPEALSTRDQPTLNHNSSKVPFEVDALKKLKLVSHNSLVSGQRFKQEKVNMPVSDQDSPSISLGMCDSESRCLSVLLPDITDSDSIYQRITNSPKNSDPPISSKEFCLSQSSSLVSSIAKSLNGETTQLSSTSAAVTDTPAKMTLVKGEISSCSSEPYGELQGLVLREKPDRHAIIPSVNNNAVVTVPSIPSVPLTSTGSAANFNESGAAKQGDSSLVKSLSEGSKFPRIKKNVYSKNHKKGQIVSEISKACIPKSLTADCYVCRRNDIKGKDILQHLVFGHLKCKLCNLRIGSCPELRDTDKKQPQCKVAYDKAHDFSVWDPSPVDFLSFQMWQFSHDRAKGAPSSKKTLLQLHNYLKMLRPLCNVKPWSSALRMCRRYADASLKFNKVCSNKSALLKASDDLLSRLVIECEISTEEELDRATVSSSSEGNFDNARDVKESSRGSVKTKSCTISASDKGKICGGSVDSEADSVSSTSVVRESSVSLVNSMPSSTSPLVVEEAPEGLVISESCTTSSSVAGEGSKGKVKSEAYSTNTFVMTESRKISVTAEDTFVEEEVKNPTSMKGEKIVEEETNGDEFVVESSDDEFKSVRPIKAPFPEVEEAEGSWGAMNNEYLLESSCSFECLDEVIEYVNLLDDASRSKSNGHNSKTLSKDLSHDKTNKHDSQGQNNMRIDSHDKNSDFQGKNDTCNDSRTKCDSRSSNSQNLNNGGVNSWDMDSQEVTENEKCKPSQVQSDFQEAILKDTSEGGSSPCGLPTLNDLPPPQETSNLRCEENCLIIKLQKDGKTVNCPEECPMCYKVLCPSRFSVNLKTFHLTSRCIGCGLFITIKFENCNEPFESERTLKRPGPKSKTGVCSAKKPKPAN
ncbi:uncharacterized protein [Macrobrachium rosenbergii]|uniref:uncharacterized protein n=1 Tax=Macrobrachium rosenbergii TaxID=79674 RepID=UPI0034D69211